MCWRGGGFSGGFFLGHLISGFYGRDHVSSQTAQHKMDNGGMHALISGIGNGVNDGALEFLGGVFHNHPLPAAMASKAASTSAKVPAGPFWAVVSTLRAWPRPGSDFS